MNNLLAALAGNQALYFLIVVGIFAIGDFFGVFSKAKISSVFVTLFIFLVGFMTNIIPKDIIELAGITGIAKISAGLIIFHMGTMINLKQLQAEWRTVVTAVLSMIVVAVCSRYSSNVRSFEMYYAIKYNLPILYFSIFQSDIRAYSVSSIDY